MDDQVYIGFSGTKIGKAVQKQICYGLGNNQPPEGLIPPRLPARHWCVVRLYLASARLLHGHQSTCLQGTFAWIARERYFALSVLQDVVVWATPLTHHLGGVTASVSIDKVRNLWLEVPIRRKSYLPLVTLVLVDTLIASSSITHSSGFVLNCGSNDIPRWDGPKVEPQDAIYLYTRELLRKKLWIQSGAWRISQGEVSV